MNLRDQLSEERKKAVEKIFAGLDPKKTGKVSIDDLCKWYSVDKNPDFISGKKTREELLKEFLAYFEHYPTYKDGYITKDDFFDYFANISTLMIDDDQFAEMLEETLKAPEEEKGEDEEMIKERVDTLVKTVRNRLLTLAKTQDEYFLRNLLNQYDSDKSGGIDVEELTWLLYKLGIAVDRKYIEALLKRFDLNNSGAIDYEEFCSFIIENPYTK
eukprot:TRINITY_DN3273_c0_g1_i18.p1 TRINITY_DN3273_c0_g1~~TRINITY_DN3273_c0_g1_i18.p1  ORF type:complete len:215 (-),score=103.12 TRINITY_DN3273_c0_g1_i18:68-712(-)